MFDFTFGDKLIGSLVAGAFEAPLLVLILGITPLMLAGHIDLSMGSVLALSDVVFGHLLLQGYTLSTSVIAAISIGALCGSLNGAVILSTGIPPFVMTLGMLEGVRAIANIWEPGERPLHEVLANPFDKVHLPWIILFLGIVYGYVLERTSFGDAIYALGGNHHKKAANRSSSLRIRFLLYVLSGTLAGFAGVCMAIMKETTTAQVGSMYELYAMTAAIMGGISLLGGEGHILFALLAGWLMGCFNGLFTLFGNSEFMIRGPLESILLGALLVIGVIIDRFKHPHRQQTLSFKNWRRTSKLHTLFKTGASK